MPVQTCKWRFERTIAMADPKGVEIAARWFGTSEEKIEQLCGRYVRGSHKGKLRGWIVYRTVIEGG